MARNIFMAVLVLASGLAFGLPGGSAGQPVSTGQAGAAGHVACPAPSFAEVAEAITPAVINVKTVVADGEAALPPAEPAAEESFGELPELTPEQHLGSGIIVDPRGIAVTNAHVVANATDIEATTIDGRHHKARVVGLDQKTDLAVVRLDDAKLPLPFAQFGDSDAIQVGDWVVAVGSPYGLGATVTKGIVSAKARHFGEGPFNDLLQTDAAINPGNSGGPLVNLQGEVIGITTAVVEGGAGIGFAIPSDIVKKVYLELLAKGRVTRAWLGVSTQPLTPMLARAFRLKRSAGALVSDVEPDSPAGKAGLRSGDILLEFDGAPIGTIGEFVRRLEGARPGQSVKLRIWRDERSQTIAVKLGDEPDERVPAPGGTRARQLLGLEVRPITPEIGVVVRGVDRGGPADIGGVRRGDVLREINRHPVRTLADFEQAMHRLKEGDQITLLLQRGSVAFYVALSPHAG